MGLFDFSKKKKSRNAAEGMAQSTVDVAKAQEEQQKREDEQRAKTILDETAKLKSKAAGLHKAEDRGTLESIRNASRSLRELSKGLMWGDSNALNNAFDLLDIEIEVAEAQVAPAELKRDYALLASETAGLGTGNTANSAFHDAEERHRLLIERREKMDALDSSWLEEPWYTELDERIRHNLKKARHKNNRLHAGKYAAMAEKADQMSDDRDQTALSAMRAELAELEKQTEEMYGGEKLSETVSKQKKNLERSIKAAESRIRESNVGALQSSYGKLIEKLEELGSGTDKKRLENYERMYQNMESLPGHDSQIGRKARERAGRALEAARGNIDRNTMKKEVEEVKVVLDAVNDASQKDQLAISGGVLTKLRQKYASMSQSEDMDQAYEAADTAMKEAAARVETSIREAHRQGKVDQAKEIIKKERKTPLETLIAKTKGMDMTAGGVRPKGEEETEENAKQSEARKGTMWSDTKEYWKKRKEAIGEYFKSELWEDVWEEFRGKIDDMAGIMGGVTGAIGDAGDYAEAAKTAEDLKGAAKFKNDGSGSFFGAEADTGSKIGTIVGVISAGLHLFSLVKNSVKGIKAEIANSSEKPTIDSQERWLTARDFLHQIVDMFGDAVGIAGGFIDAIPLLGPTLNILQGGASFILDSADMFTNSYHIEMMRKERNRLFDRINQKKEKYTAKAAAVRSQPEKDALMQAADAYTVKAKRFQTRSTDVDDKRRELLRTVALEHQTGTGADKIKIVKAGSLRSRNDSRYREAQYGLGARIRRQKLASGEKSPEEKRKLREMEALETMEEFREADKAHKKMRKALYHNIESIVTGSVGIISNGLMIAGQVSAMTGIGAAPGAGMIGIAKMMDLTTGAYEMARGAAASGYKWVRTMAGTEKNKETTRNDMALVMMDRMQEVAQSGVWGVEHFKEDAGLDQANPKDVIRQGENVRQLRSILRGGLDAKMSDLIGSGNAEELKKNIASSFGQG